MRKRNTCSSPGPRSDDGEVKLYFKWVLLLARSNAAALPRWFAHYFKSVVDVEVLDDGAPIGTKGREVAGSESVR